MFNGPLESGVRAVAMLYAAFPRSFDTQSLTALDYLLVRTSEFGGPEDLHPAAPIRTPATEVRRKTVQTALLLMMTRDLVCRLTTPNGIEYRAGESAAFFLSSLQSPYMQALMERATWLAAAVKDYDANALEALMRQLFDRWVEEFQEAEHQLGSET